MTFLDALARHPRPRPFQSITCYVRMLAYLNGFSTVDSVSDEFFPSIDRRVARELTDFGPSNFDRLPVLAVCSNEVLERTTLRPIARMFGRSTHPQALSRFLSDSIYSYVRFCPYCLTEESYYRLTWRFVQVDGCSTHKCHLLDSCIHCHKRIPLYSRPEKAGICTECQGDQRSGKISLLNEREQEEAVLATHIIEFVLASREFNEMPVVPGRLLGDYFAYLRCNKRMTVDQISVKLGVARGVIESIEKGNMITRGARFIHSWKYAGLLGTNLKEGLLMAIEHSPFLNESLSSEYLLRATTQIAELECEGKEVTQAIVAQGMDISPGTIRYHEQVHSLVNKAANRSAQRQRTIRQEEILSRVVKAKANIERDGNRVSLRAVARELGMHHTSLRSYPKVIMLILGKAVSTVNS